MALCTCTCSLVVIDNCNTISTAATRLSAALTNLESSVVTLNDHVLAAKSMRYTACIAVKELNEIEIIECTSNFQILIDLNLPINTCMCCM